MLLLWTTTTTKTKHMRFMHILSEREREQAGKALNHGENKRRERGRARAYISLLHLIIMNEFLNLTVALSKNYWWLQRIYSHRIVLCEHWTLNIYTHRKAPRERRNTNRTRKVANNQTQHTINCFWPENERAIGRDEQREREIQRRRQCSHRERTHGMNECMIHTNLARNTQMKTAKLRETFPFICWPWLFFSLVSGFLCISVFGMQVSPQFSFVVCFTVCYSSLLFFFCLVWLSRLGQTQCSVLSPVLFQSK